MPINGTRLNERLAELGRIGRTARGGVTRLSLSPDYLQARSVVAHWMEAAGLEVRVDAAGNLIGRREGAEADLPAIVIGSHIDTVIEGGRYDGAVGVLGGVEVAATLRENGVRLAHPLEVIAFVEEEAARWGISLFGSRALLGKTGSPDILDRRDRQGVTLADGMRAAGLCPGLLNSAARDPREIGAYLELHIEQGAVLDRLGLPVGIVTGIAGPLTLSLRLHGRADHAGATPMAMRRDALVAAAQLVLESQRLARESGPSAVATVGRLEVSPGASNVVPGEVLMTFDLRDISMQRRDAMEAELRQAVARIANEGGLTHDLHEESRLPPVTLPRSVIDLIRGACGDLDIPPYELPSGAYHDATAMADVTRAGMIFVRSRDGVSHSPEEFSTPEDIALGARVLYRTVRALDARRE